MKIKYNIFGLATVVSLFVFILPFIVEAQIPASVPPRTPGASGCTGFETSTSCRPEWASAISKCITNTFNSAENTCSVIINNTEQRIAVCTSNNVTGPCRPERVNPYAADTISRQAEIMGRSVGYDITCSSSMLPFWGIDTNSGLSYFMSSICTVNGVEGISAELLVNNFPSSWQTLESDILSHKAALECGGIQYVVFSTDYKTYRCTPPTTPTAPTTPTNPTAPTSPTYVPSTGYNFSAQLLNTLYSMINNLRAQLASIGNNPVDPNSFNQTTFSTGFATPMMELMRQISANLSMQVSSIGSQTGTMTPPTNPATIATTSAPFVDITLSNSAKNGVYSVGDTIYYYITMRNIDSVESYYSALPGDSCDGGSKSGEQKPWIARAIAPTSVFNAQVEACQSGNNYVITVVGRNQAIGKTSASSISVYIR